MTNLALLADGFARFVPTGRDHTGPRQGLRDHHGRRCAVYVVEQRDAGHDLAVTGRCGVRFVGDDAYWVVPALELDISPLVAVRGSSSR